jgi:hypothetical protein
LSNLPIIAALVLSSFSSLAQAADWREYTLEDDGFSVALPSKPQSKLLPVPSGGSLLRVYESLEPVRKLSKFSIFAGQTDKGIFEPASMDAYLSGHIKSMVQTVEEGQLVSSKRTTFRGQPALEYQFNQKIAGQPYVARGVTFMIDGGHMRLSMLHPNGDSAANADFARFVGSFKLTPIAYRASTMPFRDQRGITFLPPVGWIQQPVQNANQVARYSNLTRSMQVMAASTSAYSCANFRTELQGSGRLKDVSSVTLAGQRFSKLVSFEDVPKHNVQLTIVQYCLESRLGAVVLGGSEEKSMFSRWAKVFEGAAGSLHVQ